MRFKISTQYTRTVIIPAGLLALFIAAAAFAQPAPDVIWETNGHSGGVYAITFGPDGQTVLSSGDETPRLWDAADGAPLHAYGPHPNTVHSLAMSPDGSLIAAGWTTAAYPQGGLSRVWNTGDETQISEQGGAMVAFSPDGRLLATAGGGFNRYADIHRVADLVEVAHLYCGPGYITDVEFSPDSRHLAVGSTSNHIKIWDLESVSVALTLTGFEDDVVAVAFSPDGSLIAGVEGYYDLPDDANLRLFDTVSGALAGGWECHGHSAFDVTFAPDGAVVATSGRDTFNPNTYSIRYWSVPDGDLLHEFDELALALNISPDGSRLCYGGLSGRVVVAEADLPVVSDTPDAGAAGARAVLHAARPNPFNPATEIVFSLPQASKVAVDVYDLAGRRVRTLARGERAGGDHQVRWDGLDDAGGTVASGVYLVRLASGNEMQMQRVTLVK